MLVISHKQMNKSTALKIFYTVSLPARKLQKKKENWLKFFFVFFFVFQIEFKSLKMTRGDDEGHDDKKIIMWISWKEKRMLGFNVFSKLDDKYNQVSFLPLLYIYMMKIGQLR